TLFGHILTSLSRVMTGFLLAAFLGITLGLAMGWSKSTEAIVKPLFEIIRPIPPIAWISIAVIWFGLGEGAKYFIIFISGFANITINVYTGARSVDPELIGAARMLGCSDRKIFTTIVIPSSIPYIFTGLQIAISSSWAAVVAAEMVRSTDGIGWMITSGQGIGDMEQIMVGIIAIGVIGFLLATIMRGVEAKLCAWSRVQD
ncbi:MAG: ABC transporter permease, partial [Clostridia bacterium]